MWTPSSPPWQLQHWFYSDNAWTPARMDEVSNSSAERAREVKGSHLAQALLETPEPYQET